MNNRVKKNNSINICEMDWRKYYGKRNVKTQKQNHRYSSYCSLMYCHGAVIHVCFKTIQYKKRI